jgi:hypothetical protein
MPLPRSQECCGPCGECIRSCRTLFRPLTFLPGVARPHGPPTPTFLFWRKGMKPNSLPWTPESRGHFCCRHRLENKIQRGQSVHTCRRANPPMRNHLMLYPADGKLELSFGRTGSVRSLLSADATAVVPRAIQPERALVSQHQRAGAHISCPRAGKC